MLGLPLSAAGVRGVVAHGIVELTGESRWLVVWLGLVLPLSLWGCGTAGGWLVGGSCWAHCWVLREHAVLCVSPGPVAGCTAVGLCPWGWRLVWLVVGVVV